MMSKSSTLTWGTGSAVLVNVQSILNIPINNCSGICGSCGGGCAIVGLTIAGFLVTNYFYKSCREKSSPQVHNTTTPQEKIQ